MVALIFLSGIGLVLKQSHYTQKLETIAILMRLTTGFKVSNKDFQGVHHCWKINYYRIWIIGFRFGFGYFAESFDVFTRSLRIYSD